MRDKLCYFAGRLALAGREESKVVACARVAQRLERVGYFGVNASVGRLRVEFETVHLVQKELEKCFHAFCKT